MSELVVKMEKPIDCGDCFVASSRSADTDAFNCEYECAADKYEKITILVVERESDD